MRRFRFTPRHCQSDSDLELLDLRDSSKHHQIFSHICRDHPACGCAPAYSSWNCDGEILNHTAIDVRYGKGVALSDWLLLNCSQRGRGGKPPRGLNDSLWCFSGFTAGSSSCLPEGSRSRRCSATTTPTPVHSRPSHVIPPPPNTLHSVTPSESS